MLKSQLKLAIQVITMMKEVRMALEAVVAHAHDHLEDSPCHLPWLNLT